MIESLEELLSTIQSGSLNSTQAKEARDKASMLATKLFGKDNHYSEKIERVRFAGVSVGGESNGLSNGLSRLAGIMRTMKQDIEISNRKMSHQPQTTKVFVVHGHDTEMERAVSTALLKFGLDPIILHERPNRGKTIIEKFEANADVDFAIVLISPDDIARSAALEDSNFKYRPRQNVILELGYFIGKLGREHVMVLLRGDEHVEAPSDILGIVYESFDESGKWKSRLEHELKEGGFTLRSADLSNIEVLPLQLKPIGEHFSSKAQPVEPLDDKDLEPIISAWWDDLSERDQEKAWRFTEVDEILKIPKGSALKAMERIVTAAGDYKVISKGPNAIRFEYVSSESGDSDNWIF